jgi:hypothetical protein
VNSSTRSKQPGHLFVVRSRLESFRSDVVIIPTSGKFGIREQWHAALKSDPAAHRPDGWTSGSVEMSASDPTIWFIDVTGRVSELKARLRRLFEGIAAHLPAPQVGNPLPRVAIPVVGVGGGGHGRERGRVIEVLVDVGRSTVDAHAYDIVISAINDSDFAAIQAHRRSLADQSYEFANKAKALARLARSGELALFMGAGVSIPAGLPSWDSMIDQLSGDDRDEIMRLKDPLDQGELLRRKHTTDLGAQVASLTDAHGEHALSHALLASLNCREVVTTNFDQCYESAADRDALAVLPWRAPAGERGWLLKLHGSREHPESIVLARRDFVRFQAKWGPAGAVLQALLMTRHLLVVGASFEDSNLLRLVHEVAEFREAHGVEPVMGTVVALTAEPARERLLEGEFDYVAMTPFGARPDQLPHAARMLEIFLDVLAMYAAAEAPYLLDRRYADLLKCPGEAEVAAKLAEMLREVIGLSERHDTSDAWGQVADTLRAWGARSPTAPSDRPRLDIGRPARQRRSGR